MEDKWIPITLINQSKEKGRCRFLSVTQETIGKLKMTRPGVYLDDPRLTFVKDLPEHKKPPQTKAEPQISPERQAWLDGAYAKYLANQAVTPAQPQPEQTRTPEEDWRTRPDIRAEFVSLASYEAYMRAEKAGRTKVYGRG